MAGKSALEISKFIRYLQVAVLIFGIHQSAFCFSLEDHKNITEVAINEINRCKPGTISIDQLDTFIEMNLNEDLNVARKWSYASHYYNPEHPVFAGWRKDASYRLLELINEFESTNSKETKNQTIGAILHYVQDMASPPHVVPVAHGLTDGFEGFETTIPENHDCNRINNQDSIFTIFETTSTTTLNRIRTNSIPALIPGIKEGSIPWSSFWDESDLDPKSSFGKYGEVGNFFGSNLLDFRKTKIFVYDKDYAKAKSLQLRLAVDATKEIIEMFF